MLRIKVLALALFAAFAAALLLTDNFANPHARAYSAGPPAGYGAASRAASIIAPLIRP